MQLYKATITRQDEADEVMATKIETTDIVMFEILLDGLAKDTEMQDELAYALQELNRDGKVKMEMLDCIVEIQKG